MACFFFPLLAAAEGVAPGSYVYRGGFGSLEITGAAGTDQTWKLETMGGMGSACMADGTLRGLDATTTTKPFEPGMCKFKLEPKLGGLEVSVITRSECRLYCGARAGFEGRYLKPPKGCSVPEVRATRAAFGKQQDAKNYLGAKKTLLPLQTGCAGLVNDIDRGFILNDLALTEHRLGDDPACLLTLQPVRKMAQWEFTNPDEPQYNSDYQPLIKKLQATLRLCGDKPPVRDTSDPDAPKIP